MIFQSKLFLTSSFLTKNIKLRTNGGMYFETNLPLKSAIWSLNAFSISNENGIETTKNQKVFNLKFLLKILTSLL